MDGMRLAHTNVCLARWKHMEEGDHHEVEDSRSSNYKIRNTLTEIVGSLIGAY